MSSLLNSNWPYGVTYQVFIQSFYDSNGDGIGDLNGLTAKLDYLADLGVEAVWLMPVNPSPSYHKYDITNHYDIHPDYGTLNDFRKLVDGAHRRRIKILMDLVIGHCSVDHSWFQQARKNPSSPFRNYFRWASQAEILKIDSLTKEVTEDSDNIYQWHSVPNNKLRYYAYFGSSLPNLNFDNIEVREELFKIGRYWLAFGVDGFRLDAAKHIYPVNRANDIHAFWVEFRSEMERIKPDVHLVGEVWDSAEVIAPYLKGLKSNFNFDLGYAIMDAVRKNNGRDLVKTFIRINQYYHTVTDDFYDATFLRNHDQNRIMSYFRGNQAKAKLAGSILLTLPGSPFIYYGEELGMRGKKPDIYIREPFPWGEKDPGQTTWMQSKYNAGSKTSSLADQVHDKQSIFHHYRNLIQLRRQYDQLSMGKIEEMAVSNKNICAFVRDYREARLEVVHNLSSRRNELPVTGSEIIYQSDQAKLANGYLEIPGYSTVIVK